MKEMSIDEAIYCMKCELCEEVCEECTYYGQTGTDHCEEDAIRMAIQALEEIQAYRAIGTVEEIKSTIQCNLILLRAYEELGTIEEFKALKEKNNKGVLLRLPCAIGSTVYALTPFCEICEEALDNTYACENCKKGKFVTETKFDYEMIPMVGKVVFLTIEEAERALENRQDIDWSE